MPKPPVPPPGTPPRQTLTYLRNLFERRGLSPRHRLGQNFLIDLNLHDVIVAAAEIEPHDVVLEVGPGAGALTSRMGPLASAVVAVEYDTEMALLTQEAVASMPNVRILNADALAGKNRLNPMMLDNVCAGLAFAPDRRFKLVANLPYNIATPLLTNLLVHPEPAPVPDRMVVTIQLELAQKMTAEPATSHYSGLSVLMQALSDVEIVRTLAPTVFWPRPKVDSAIVDVRPNPEKRAMIGDVAWFQQVVRTIFLHRRKNLRSVLLSEWRDRWPGGKPEIDAFLAKLGLAETGIVRAETLNVEEFLDLANALKAHFGIGSSEEADLEDEDEDEDEDESESESEPESD
jgi:16S rRNA (adenine1518-N6/adenine1519-N6)-dimethyltransferase